MWFVGCGSWEEDEQYFVSNFFFFYFLWEKKMNSKGVVFLGYFQRGFLGNFAKVFFFEKI